MTNNCLRTERIMTTNNKNEKSTNQKMIETYTNENLEHFSSNTILAQFLKDQIKELEDTDLEVISDSISEKNYCSSVILVRDGQVVPLMTLNNPIKCSESDQLMIIFNISFKITIGNDVSYINIIVQEAKDCFSLSELNHLAVQEFLHSPACMEALHNNSNKFLHKYYAYTILTSCSDNCAVESVFMTWTEDNTKSDQKIAKFIFLETADSGENFFTTGIIDKEQQFLH